MPFIKEWGNWVEYRNRFDGLVECDFHWSEEGRGGSYYENMDMVWNRALEVLQKAQAEGKEYVLFSHGWSTSRMGTTTSRSQVRKLMRSKDSTPYIIRSKSIQHNSVFVAAIRPLKKDK
jgi:hypothetical protein